MPPDTNHPALLTDFVEGLIPLLELCNIHALDPQQLAAWAASDHTQRDLAALAHLAQLRAAAIAAQAHPTALARLATIALSPTPTDPNADTTGPEPPPSRPARPREPRRTGCYPQTPMTLP
ncbi:MAG: hypothetical protein R3B68_01250 [Phycisphaerales bacterium]